MSNFLSSKINKFLYLHPFLFAVYPTFFLYALNIKHFREDVVLVPLFLSLLFSGVVFVLLRIITKNIQVSAVLSSYLILAFFSYSRIRDFIKRTQFEIGAFRITPEIIIYTILITVLIFLIYATIKYKTRLRKINKLLTVLSVFLVSISLFNIILFEIKSGRILRSESQDTGEQMSSQETVGPKRDIYYFIFDRYGGGKTLNLYGFDNSSFYNYLNEKGFYIASKATSNYPKTFQSLGSSLNLGYINYLTEKTNGGGTSDESIVTPLVKNNKVVKFLKNKGYSYIHVGSGWDPTRSNKNADYNFVLNGGSYPFADEFTNGLLQTTLASPILKEIYKDPTAVSDDPKKNDHRSRVLYEFDVFDQVVNIDGPKFVFAHILIPHDPYVLDQNCKPISEKIVEAKQEMENYINQLQCANTKIKEVIDLILLNSKEEPIIILQADEGPYPIKYRIGPKTNWQDASDDSLNEKFPILNAYLLPGLEQNPMYDTITPVNTFRLLFNSYFNANYSTLPDRNYIFKDAENYYKFTDVTDRVIK